MRLRQYFLNESVIIIGFKDLPDWVKNIMKEKKMKKDVEVNIGADVNIGSNWHDSNVREIFAYKNGKVKSQLAIGTQSLGDSPKDLIAKKGFKYTLKQGEM
ncbi:MAG: hypothetical protein WC260_04105, partial [Candidatus Pacearchaeota archaeon]